jgi:ankyrin repeat protein
LALGADPNDGDDFAIAIASHLRAWMGNRSRAYGIDPMQILDWAVAQGFSPELHAGAMLSEIVGFIELSESLECVKILADYGAAPSKVSPTGPSPLSLCIDWCKYDLAWALADQGLPLDYVDQRGETAFHLLAKHATKPHVLARAKLAERPATPALLRLESRHPERMGQTPLHIACATLNSEAIRLYLASGADPNALDAQGWSPLRHLLRKNGAQKAAKSEAALRMLLNAGADASLPDSSGLTPAQATSARAHLGALGILLEARPEDVSAQTPASAKARSKLEARGHQGQSLSEKAQMTSIASSSESCAPPARSSKSL